MKKVLALSLIVAALTGCGNDGSNSNSTDTNTDNGVGSGPSSTDEDTTAVNVHNVENANGNIPDTTNSINIGTESRSNSKPDSSNK